MIPARWRSSNASARGRHRRSQRSSMEIGQTEGPLIIAMEVAVHPMMQLSARQVKLCRSCMTKPWFAARSQRTGGGHSHRARVNLRCWLASTSLCRKRSRTASVNWSLAILIRSDLGPDLVPTTHPPRHTDPQTHRGSQSVPQVSQTWPTSAPKSDPTSVPQGITLQAPKRTSLRSLFVLELSCILLAFQFVWQWRRRESQPAVAILIPPRKQRFHVQDVEVQALQPPCSCSS